MSASSTLADSTEQPPTFFVHPPKEEDPYDVISQPAAPEPSSPIEIAVGDLSSPRPPAPEVANEILTIDGTSQYPPPDEEAGDGDGDSAIGDDRSAVSSTTSLAIFNYQYENGRRYHAFRQGQYWLPNDDAEQDRLDLMHHIFRLILGGSLFRSPITRNPQRVLDMGTGTGIWAIEFADEFPSAAVIGNDLSPIQPNWVPPNCRFIIDDLESEWLYKRHEPFDFIHGRAVAGSIKDWPRLYEEIFRHLKPGGWVEIQEYEGTFSSDEDPELVKAPSIRQWQELVDEATTRLGQKLNVAGDQKQYMEDAGFINVRDDVYKVPGGTWPHDPRLKNIGAYQYMHLLDCVEPFTLATFKRALDWTEDQMTVIIAKVKGDIRNRKNYLYTNFHFVYAQKPFDY